MGTVCTLRRSIKKINIRLMQTARMQPFLKKPTYMSSHIFQRNYKVYLGDVKHVLDPFDHKKLFLGRCPGVSTNKILKMKKLILTDPKR